MYIFFWSSPLMPMFCQCNLFFSCACILLFPVKCTELEQSVLALSGVRFSRIFLLISRVFFFLFMFILVNEVVWEGEETEVKNIESDMPKKVESGTTNAKTNIATNTNNRLVLLSLHSYFLVSSPSFLLPSMKKPTTA